MLCSTRLLHLAQRLKEEERQRIPPSAPGISRVRTHKLRTTTRGGEQQAEGEEQHSVSIPRSLADETRCN